MKHRIRNIAGGVLLLSLMHAAGAADAPNGKALFEKHCTACHGTEVFTRPNHKMQSLAMLNTQVQRCERPAGADWSDAQSSAVVNYINDNFYKFKK